MRSEFAEWLDQMQHIADKENVVVQARHYDLLDYQFKKKIAAAEAFDEYKKFLVRWNAITRNGRFTEAAGGVIPDKQTDMQAELDRLRYGVSDLQNKVWDCRNYLMGTEPNKVSIGAALEALGFQQNGLTIS